MSKPWSPYSCPQFGSVVKVRIPQTGEYLGRGEIVDVKCGGLDGSTVTILFEPLGGTAEYPESWIVGVDWQ